MKVDDVVLDLAPLSDVTKIESLKRKDIIQEFKQRYRKRFAKTNNKVFLIKGPTKSYF